MKQARDALKAFLHKRTEFGRWKFRVTAPPVNAPTTVFKKYLFAFLSFYIISFASKNILRAPSTPHHTTIIRTHRLSHSFIFKLHPPLILAATYSSFVQKIHMYISSRQDKKTRSYITIILYIRIPVCVLWVCICGGGGGGGVASIFSFDPYYCYPWDTRSCMRARMCVCVCLCVCSRLRERPYFFHLSSNRSLPLSLRTNVEPI